ncbi:MAG: hypothetical protein OHK0039_41690 [Bacteroidia bacterium]
MAQKGIEQRKPVLDLVDKGIDGVGAQALAGSTPQPVEPSHDFAVADSHPALQLLECILGLLTTQ